MTFSSRILVALCPQYSLPHALQARCRDHPIQVLCPQAVAIHRVSRLVDCEGWSQEERFPVFREPDTFPAQRTMQVALDKTGTDMRVVEVVFVIGVVQEEIPPFLVKAEFSGLVDVSECDAFKIISG